MQQFITIPMEQLDTLINERIEVSLAKHGAISALVTRKEAIVIAGGSIRLVDSLITGNLLIPILDPNGSKKRYSRKQLIELLTTNNRAKRIVTRRKTIKSKQ